MGTRGTGPSAGIARSSENRHLSFDPRALTARLPDRHPAQTGTLVETSAVRPVNDWPRAPTAADARTGWGPPHLQMVPLDGV